MKYIFNFTDNVYQFSNGEAEDSFFEKEYRFKNDHDALIKALIIEEIYDKFDQELVEKFKNLTLEQLKERARSVDHGSPIVFSIKNEKGDVVYNCR